MTITAPPPDLREKARSLYWQGWRASDIAKELDITPATIRSWKRRDAWKDVAPLDRVEHALEARMAQLVAKENKTAGDFKEIDLLGRQMERLARIHRYQNGGTEKDLNPNIEARNAGSKKPRKKNEITEEQAAELRKIFFGEIWDYQKKWYDAGQQHRFRNILKSRQIGATYYFAHEALIDAIDTGRNQIFLSASRAQALQFKSYIAAFAARVGIKLEGDPILLPNGAELRFVSTNSRTAQSYHGNLYVDEYFWLPKFNELRKTAQAMASHKHWRITYFSTPSAITHEAYAFWTGKNYNKGRAKAEHITIDVSHDALKDGSLGPDGQWRQIVTVEDAVAQGCNLFELEQIRRENSPLEYLQLYMAQFIDDTDAVFGFAMMQACLVDSMLAWNGDWSPFRPRPLGHRPVWLGYDPASTGDMAALAVIAPPIVAGAPFRILEKHQWRGMDFAKQAEAIEKLTKKYNVAYIGIDCTGIGAGVYQTVQQFFPAVRGFNYSPDIKNRLVLKAYDVISHGRLQFDISWIDVAAAFMAIRKSITPSGRQATYTVSRSDDISHADLAWAVMHALANEPLAGQASQQSLVEFS